MGSTVRLPIAIFLMGPTAAGKTALTFALHEHFPVDVISVDAAQVYRGMDIGTAKPSAAERARVPHRLIDIRDPADSYSAAQFYADARKEMDASVSRGRIPLLSGGTMFYFRALERGLSNLPGADAAVREQLTAQARTQGWPALHAALAAQDRASAARIDPHDAQRIQRALEIIALTGQTPSALRAGESRSPLPFRIVKIAVNPPTRKLLHERIALRFHAMLDAGLLAEVELLFRRGDLSPALPSMRTVGYRRAWEYLSQVIDYDEMVARSIYATRQLAKRQLTWLRADPDLRWFDSTDTQLIRNSVSWLQQRLACEE